MLGRVRKGINKMTVREYGKLKRLPDVYYGMDDSHHYPLWIDEAGNEYRGSYSRDGCYCIITADGGVI